MNQTASTSIYYFQQLSRNTFSKSWLRFFVIASIFCGIALILSYFFNHYFLSAILFIMTILWGRARVKHLQRTKLLAEFKIPANIWSAFKQRHPNISSSAYPYIEEGFKDYLAIHMRQRNSYAMPSHSVDALWHLLLEEYESFYESICQNFLGYSLIHKPYEKESTSAQKAAQRQQLINTWQAACHLHGLQPANPHVLPRLFQIDEHIQWEHGIKVSLPFMVAMYAQMMQSASDAPIINASQSSCSSTSTACSGSSSAADSGHSPHGSDSSSDSSCNSCSSCGGGD